MEKIDRKLLKISTALIAIAIIILVTLTTVQFEKLTTAIIAINTGTEVLLAIALGFVYSIVDDKG